MSQWQQRGWSCGVDMGKELEPEPGLGCRGTGWRLPGHALRPFSEPDTGIQQRAPEMPCAVPWDLQEPLLRPHGQDSRPGASSCRWFLDLWVILPRPQPSPRTGQSLLWTRALPG